MADPVDTPLGEVTPEQFRPGHVRHRLFVGPKFIYALFNPQDRMHPVSRAFMTFVRDGDLPYRHLIVNEHIVNEAATRLKKRASMRNAAKFLTAIESGMVYQLERVPDESFDEATETFAEWTNSPAGFTDFVVAAHMDHLDIDHIATYDGHYGAFGVTPLPYREP
jgi:predicted nucleic acid-binding protein